MTDVSIKIDKTAIFATKKNAVNLR